MSESVAAVVVTYNRSQLLLECLDALLRQTRPLDKIVLIDNASTDGTAEILAARGYLKHAVIDYVRLPNNTGGAGGFHEGVKRAFETGFDWFWLMDDDAEPYHDALERMEPMFARDGIAGVANLAVTAAGLPDLEHRGWLALRGTTPRAHRPIEATGLDRELEISFASFVGLAVHRTAVERVGLPKRELFIKGDDLEYCMRLSILGPIMLVPQSRIVNKDGLVGTLVPCTRFGRTSYRVPFDKLWLSYFSLRNLTWIRRRHCGPMVAATFALRQYSRQIVGILLYDSERLVRLGFFAHAISDAWLGVFDNDKPKRLTRRQTPGSSPGPLKRDGHAES
jgi:rhamnopyranosyl-N-acetylglucosaminyl-diphospho-decaprenol beta-1,3/1,4-galactofuranosyltransferase